MLTRRPHLLTELLFIYQLHGGITEPIPDLLQRWGKEQGDTSLDSDKGAVTFGAFVSFSFCIRPASGTLCTTAKILIYQRM